MQRQSLDKLDPDLAIRPGMLDPRLILGLWCVRKTFFPLIWLGMIVAIVALGDLDSFNDQLSGFGESGASVDSFLSPLFGLVLAVVVRFAANWLALAATAPLTLTTDRIDYLSLSRWAQHPRLWWDRLYLARAYRSLRWTWAVRNHARSG